MPVLQSVGAHVPHWRLSDATVAAAWGSSAGRGRRSVADRDEDALTLAAQAVADLDADVTGVDTLLLASTSAPYVEKSNASVLAAVLDTGHTTRGLDVTGSRRSWLSALALATDLARSGSSSTALVAAGDVRPAEPHTPDELAFGDAGGAALVAADGDGAEVLAHAAVQADDLGSWRRAGDPHVVHAEQRFALATSELEPAVEAVQTAVKLAGLTIDDVAVLAVSSAHAALGTRLAAALGHQGGLVVDGPERVGYTGAAHAPLVLATALSGASDGDVVVAVATGDGAEAVAVRASDACRVVLPATAPAGTDRDVRYAGFLRARGTLPVDVEPPRSSSVAHHRDAGQTLALRGMTCHACGEVQYPVTPRCAYCASTDVAPMHLAHADTVQTFTADHIVAGINPGNGEGVVTMAVVDLDRGGRVFVQCTSELTALEVGQRVDLVVRHLHDGSGFRNYYWKAAPPRTAERAARS